LLQDKHAVIYGGGGAIGGAVARAFVREGATVHLASTTLGRAATLADVGDVAAFVASDKARTMIVATVNVSAGALLD
jgi:NAD(P)-dependent dehydrogenase (short-subunit alcohol dehydrogenase family)